MFSLTSTSLSWHTFTKPWLFSRMKQPLHLHVQLYPANHWTLKQTEKKKNPWPLQNRTRIFFQQTHPYKKRLLKEVWYMLETCHGSIMVFICSFKILLISLFLRSQCSCRLQDYFDYVIICKCNKMLFWKYCAPCLLLLPKGPK